MRAVIKRGRKLVVDEMAPPPLTEGLVRVKTLACGICGSDLHALDYMDRMTANAPAQPGRDPNADMVFGHEFCCEILENGPGTQGKFKPGQHVCSMPIVMSAGGIEPVGYSTRLPGGFAEEMVLTESMLLPVPNGLAPEQAALTEPLAVGEHAVAMGTPNPGKEGYLVIGCGPVGLAVIASLKARGLGPIIAADFSEPRRKLAERMGADKIIDPAQVSPHSSWADFSIPTTRQEQMAAQMMGGSKKAIIFECVGVPGVLQQLANEGPAGSRIVVAGVCMETDKIEPLSFINKEIELRFVLGYTGPEFAQSLTRLAEGQTRYNDIVTNIVSLEETPDAFVKLQTDKNQVKILVKPSK